MFYNRLFWANPLFAPVIEQPVFQASSSMKYTEDNTDITYTISLPENVDEDGIGATIKDGVLTIIIPKLVDEPKVEPGTIKVKRG